MSARKWSNTNRRFIGLTLCALAVGLGGCVDYVKHSDTVTLSAGETQAWNKTIHITDPWPPQVMNTRIPGDGQRTAKVIGRYSTGAGEAGSAQSSAGAEAGAAEGAKSD